MSIEESIKSAQCGQPTAGYWRTPLLPARLEPRGISRVLRMLGDQTSLDFSPYKQCTILRGIDERMAYHQLASASEYAFYLEKHPEEVQLLFSKLLIRVTQFFRDPGAFARLKTWLGSLVLRRPPDSLIRVWVPACATGEEAYSLAILLHERATACRHPCEFHVIGSDIDLDAIEEARKGVYPFRIAQDVSDQRLGQFFTKGDHGYRVNEELRSRVSFLAQDVVNHFPSHRVNLISCRNLMIYLNPELQDFLLTAFHRTLLPGGALFLSPSETIGERVDLFKTISRKWKLYEANSLRPLAAPGRQAI
jgi:two-component system CheB/CheR fusion protein